MNGMMRDILKLRTPDFKSLVETRIVLEKSLIELAAQRRTEEDLAKIESALNAFREKVTADGSAVEEDMMFHLKIAEASGNSALHSLIMIITPEIIMYFNKKHICDSVEAEKLISEHSNIFNAIKDKDPKRAVAALDTHFSGLKSYCYG